VSSQALCEAVLMKQMYEKAGICEQ